MPVVRKATDADLAEVLRWLEEQDAQGVQGTFWCNRGVIHSSHQAGEMTVLADKETAVPIGFCLRHRDDIVIFEIRADQRRRGLGREFARAVIDEARMEELPGVRCECSPRTSISFWEGLGFRRVEPDKDRYLVALPFVHRQELFPGAPPTTVRIQLFDELSGEPVGPAFETIADAVDGLLDLETVFVAYVATSDTRIRIEADGFPVCFEKVKYAKDNGVERCAPWVMVRQYEPPQP
jgi:GNAT superfamily N-acetyltransferase